jgi:hypothetical protein
VDMVPDIPEKLAREKGLAGVQAGTAESLIGWLDRAATVIANGYWGQRLGGGTLTERERAETAKLKSYFEQKGRVLILERQPI